MEIQIQEVKSAKDLKTFIFLPEKIHREHPNWLPPLYIDEKSFFNREKNPQFKENETILFLAFKDGKPIGRIMGLVPNEFNKLNQVQSARFSYLECYEDEVVFNALLDAVTIWAKNLNCNKLIGPMGFSDKEPQGFLTFGFDEKTMMVTNCSFEYMKTYSENAGLEPFVNLCQYEVPLKEDVIIRYEPIMQRVLRNSKVQIKEFSSTREIKPFVQGVFDLINSTYTDIYGFTKVSKEEADEFAKRFIPLLDPRLVKLILDQEDQVVAFVIAMPDLSKAIRKTKGRLLPFGWIKILREMKKSKRLVLLLGGVHPKFQNKGLDAVLAVKLIGSALKLGFTTMDSHLIMEENDKMRREIERLPNNRLYKKYTIYSKPL